MSLIIDAYNVLQESHLLPDRYAMIGPAELCALLEQMGLHRGSAVVVCDGDPKPIEKPYASTPAMRLVYSGPSQDADTIIERLIAADSNPRDLVVVSSDRRLKAAARRRGAASQGAATFIRALRQALQARQAPAEAPEKPAVVEDVQGWLKTFGYGQGPPKDRPRSGS